MTRDDEPLGATRTVLFVLAILLLLAGSLCLAIAGAPR